MARSLSLLTGFVTLALATAAGAYAFPERGLRSTNMSGSAVTDVTLPESGDPEVAQPAPAAGPARSTRVKTSRDAGRERTPTASRAVEEPASAAQAPVSTASEPLTVPAQPAVPVQQPEPPAEVSLPAPSPAEVLPQAADDFAMLRALGGIGIVLSLMIGGFFAIRRFAPNLIQRPSVQKTLKVVETLPMGDKRSISIIEVGERRLLLGNTSGRITLLATLDGPISGEVSGAPLEVPPRRAQTPAGSFRNVFELEKPPVAVRSGGIPKTIAPDIRAKMRQLRQSLEE